MAKDGTLEHPKTLMLAALLEIDPPSALGLMEALWAFARKYAPEGDIGKFPDLMIVQGTRTGINPARVMKAWIECRWIDRNEAHRLVIHDWEDHSTKTTIRIVKARGKGFAKGQDSRRNTNTTAATEARKDTVTLQTNAANDAASASANAAKSQPFAANAPPDNAANASAAAIPTLQTNAAKVPFAASPCARSGPYPTIPPIKQEVITSLVSPPAACREGSLASLNLPGPDIPPEVSPGWVENPLSDRAIARAGRGMGPAPNAQLSKLAKARQEAWRKAQAEKRIGFRQEPEPPPDRPRRFGKHLPESSCADGNPMDGTP